MVADLRDVRERVADKSKACREPVRRLYVYVADVASDPRLGRKLQKKILNPCLFNAFDRLPFGNTG